MHIKYNRTSTTQQKGNRFSEDKSNYDLVLQDTISGTVPFKDRPKAKMICEYISKGIVKSLTIEEFSRIGRNTSDIITNLAWLDEMKVNVKVRNIGLESRPNGLKNPIWDLIATVMSGIYALELENIKERTHAGRVAYLKNGGVLGRPMGTEENGNKFLQKEKSVKIIKALKRNLTIREVANLTDSSTRTVQKVKTLATEYNLL
ncbi:MAG: recombinase family protein [Pedobacter sp.]|nr:MAG: recombinase family protein [Pedobacter sp.]